MIKIKKWEELHDVRAGDRIISYSDGYVNKYIQIRKQSNQLINTFAISEYTAEELLGILKAIGFDIEFIIEPKLTQKERDFLECFRLPEFKSVKRYRDTLGFVYLDNRLYINPDMFKFIKTGESMSFNDLFKLEVEG